MGRDRGAFWTGSVQKMKEALPVLSIVVAVAFPVPHVAASSSSEAPAEAYLEGAWLVGERPSSGSCTTHSYSNNQIEFEFRRSGGRIISYEPYDLFTAAAVSNVEKGDGATELTIVDSDRKAIGVLRLRALGPDRLGLQLLAAETEKGPVEIAYRCDNANGAVTEYLSQSMMNVLTAPETGVALFVASNDGQNDKDVCRMDSSVDAHWLQFEVIGPVHYYLFGRGFGSKFDLAAIKSIRSTSNDSFSIEFVESLPGGEAAWDRRTHVRLHTLTAKWDGRRLDMPDLGVTFVRCIGTPKAGYVPAPVLIGQD